MHPELAVLEELVDIVPGAPLRKTDRARFLRSFTLPVDNADLKTRASKSWVLQVIGGAAYEMPLPPRWTEQVDTRGYIYFSHALRTEATWEHPLLGAFKETLEFAMAIVNSGETLAEAAGAVKAHLRQVQDRAAAQLKDWTGPHRETGSSDEFFYNEETSESTWESPLEVWQYELHARYWLLVQMLQHMHLQQLGAVPPMNCSTASPPNGSPSSLPTSSPTKPAVASPSPYTEDDTQRREWTSPGEGSSVQGSNVFNSSPNGGSPGVLSRSPSGGATGSVAKAAMHTPRFLELSGVSEEMASIVESTLSTSGLSAAVRSHATEIASSLASSAPSFGMPCIRPAPRYTDASRPQPPKQPPPPKKPPPPLRHLAAPPRVTDVPSEKALRVQSPTLCIGSPKAASSGRRPPPPPPKPGGAEQRSMRRAPPRVCPPPPPPKAPKRFGSEAMEDFEPPAEELASPQASARQNSARSQSVAGDSIASSARGYPSPALFSKRPPPPPEKNGDAPITTKQQTDKGPSVTRVDVGPAKRSAENGPSVKRVEVAPAKERVVDIGDLEHELSLVREVSPVDSKLSSEKDGPSVTRVEVSPAKSSEKEGMSITRVQVSPAKSQSREEDSEGKTEEAPESPKPSEVPVKDSCKPSDAPEGEPTAVKNGKSPKDFGRSLSDGGWAGKPVKRRSAWASMVCTLS